MQNKLTAPITPREQDIMNLLTKHYTYSEICSKLGISIRTVNRHIDNLMKKTGFHRQEHLTKLAIEQGYGKDEESHDSTH